MNSALQRKLVKIRLFRLFVSSNQVGNDVEKATPATSRCRHKSESDEISKTPIKVSSRRRHSSDSNTLPRYKENFRNTRLNPDI